MKIQVQITQEATVRSMEFPITKTELRSVINAISDSLASFIHKRVKIAKTQNKHYLKANKPLGIRIQAGTKVIMNSRKLDCVDALGFELKFNSLRTPQQIQNLSRKLKFVMDEFCTEFRIVDFGDDVLGNVEASIDAMDVSWLDEYLAKKDAK